ncbi:PAS/LOV protein B isoform X1 [Carex rostrata]
MDSFHLSLTSRYSDWVLEALDELSDCFLITDPAISGHPIVFASQSFLSISGYAQSEILGKNPRLFQGPETDRGSISQIREAVRTQSTVQVMLVNYRKDGTPHQVLFHMSPVFGQVDGTVVHFFAVQVPIVKRPGTRHGACSRALLRGCRDEVRRGCDAPAQKLFDNVCSKVSEGGESCIAGEWEKETALNSANNIISALNLYSKLTGLVVGTKKCCGPRTIPALSSCLKLSLGGINKSFLLSDPHLPGMPIVYASDAFLSLTGYSRCEVLGRNSKFLNGPGTCSKALQQQINKSIGAEKSCTVRLLNYRKDGSSFWNLFHISPVRNASGKEQIAYYIGAILDEASQGELNGISPEMWQFGTVGAVKVAVRSISFSCAGPSR